MIVSKKKNMYYLNKMEKKNVNTFSSRVMLNGHCHTVWQLYKKLEDGLASIEF